MTVSHLYSPGVSDSDCLGDIDSYVQKPFLRVKKVYKGYKFAIDAKVQKILNLVAIVTTLGGEARESEDLEARSDEIMVTVNGEYDTLKYADIFNCMYFNRSFRGQPT